MTTRLFGYELVLKVGRTEVQVPLVPLLDAEGKVVIDLDKLVERIHAVQLEKGE